MVLTKESAAVFLVATAVLVVRGCAGSNSSSQLEACNFTSPHFSPAVMADIQQILKREIVRQRHLGESREYAATSCEEIREIKACKLPGVYWIQGEHGTDRSCCRNQKDEWKVVANVTMQVNSVCPSGLETVVEGSKRLCRKPGSGGGCASVTFSTHGVEYCQVKGKVIGYLYNSLYAFGAPPTSVDAVYLDGVSITHGSNPRSHIWTFAVAEHQHTSTSYNCPCLNPASSSMVPHFVGDDYFCDTASVRAQSGLKSQNPLWDGEGCWESNRCCDNQPWFYKNLTDFTTDSIELRLCRYWGINWGDLLLESIEIYVQ